jgi:lysophospholipase L1-like esterase
LLGTNDANTNLNESNSAFVNDYVKLVDLFQGLASKPKVWVVEPPPIFNNTSGLSPDYLVQNVIPDIQQVANQTGASVIDVYNPLVNHSAYFLVDGVHPDSDGAKAIATIMYNAVFSNDNPVVPLDQQKQSAGSFTATTLGH